MNERYLRQIAFTPVGEEGQRRISKSRVALVGSGALGSSIANYLVRSGVGYLRIIDDDVVKLSNLQRQMLFDVHDAKEKRHKAETAARRLREINPDVVVEPVTRRLTADNAEELLGDIDLILDGTDNLPTRYSINDASIKLRIPWIYGGCVGGHGMSFNIFPGETACFACIFPDTGVYNTATADTVGIVGPIAAAVAAIQSVEAIKFLSGNRTAMRDTLIYLDLWENTYTEFNPGPPQPTCRCSSLQELADFRGN